MYSYVYIVMGLCRVGTLWVKIQVNGTRAETRALYNFLKNSGTEHTRFSVALVVVVK